MKINWNVRIHNPLWWVQIIGSILTPMLMYFGFNWQDMTTWANLGGLFVATFKNPVVIVAVLWSLFNTINDPTTKGLSDSQRALSYYKPH